MTLADQLESPKRLIMAVVLGVYAAAIALAPTPAIALTLAAPLVVIPLLWWTLLAPAHWLGLFFFAVLLLPPLPIPLGDAGPHPALAVAALGLFIGLVRMREWRVPADWLSLSILAFLCTLLGSIALAAIYSGLTIAAGSLARVVLFGFSVYIFLYVAHGPASLDRSDPMRAARLLFWAGVGSAAFACADFYYQLPAPAGYGPQFIWLGSSVLRRAQGLFYEASTLGNLCAFFLVMIAVALFRRVKGHPREFRLVPLVAGGGVISAALIFSYSRASVLNVLVALAALVYLQRERIAIRKLVIGLVISVAGGAALCYALFPAVAGAYLFRLSTTWQNLFSATEGVFSGRLESWRYLAGFLIDHPWHALVGVGYKTLPYSDYVGRTVIADNMYLSLLVETGIVGLAALCLMNFAILRTSWCAARSPLPRASFFGTWIFCFWCGQVAQLASGDLLTYWRVLPLYFWALAVAVRESSLTAGE